MSRNPPLHSCQNKHLSWCNSYLGRRGNRIRDALVSQSIDGNRENFLSLSELYFEKLFT